MEYIDLSTHCLVKKMHSDRMQRIRFHEGDFFLPDADIAVLHNDALRRIRANQISDGMQLFVGYERQYYSIGEWFSREQFICWLSIYREFDEILGVQVAYLYKHNKDADQLDRINAFLITQWSSCRVVVKNKFVQLIDVGDTVRTHTSVLSFFLWLVVGYIGKATVVEGKLLHLSVQIPLVWTIIEDPSLFVWMKQELGKEWLFFQDRIVQQKIGASWELYIRDPELLSLIATILQYDATHVIGDASLYQDVWLFDSSKSVWKLLRK